jgi:hypothetical protein
MSNDAGQGRMIRRVMLFVADNEPNSIAALENFQKLREATPEYQFQLQVVNVLEQYRAALEYNVLVTPCLILIEPPPRVMVVGTLKDLDKVRAALRLRLDRVGTHA